MNDSKSADAIPSLDPPPDSSPAHADSIGWWALESDAQAAPWRSSGNSLLEDLHDVPAGDEDRTTFAWQPGYELTVQGHGGFVSRERRRYTLVGHRGRYLNNVGGHQTVVAGSQSNRVKDERVVSIERPDETSGMDAPWGLDRLAVKGDARYEFGSRTLMMSGIVERNWNGGVMRLASMEGIVCGGAMTRVIGGPSATLSGMATGDVYGGIARVSAVRSYLSVLHYRAAKAAAWAMGYYMRNATFTIEPMFSPPAGMVPKANTAAKMNRLQRVMSRASKAARKLAKAVARTKAARGAKAVGEGARMVCPLVDIIAGVAALPFAIIGIIGLIRTLAGSGKPIPIPPAGPARVRNRSGVNVSQFASQTFM